ncbi:MAG TPA: ABC transporter permease [Thermomicrobiaceae bacterium]|nr:ABC transporter permease [Thermomicrobiaceae bacterium]
MTATTRATPTIAPAPRPLLERLVPRPFRRSPLAFAAVAIVLAWVLLALAAPLIAPYGPLTQEFAQRLTGPSRAHLLGTDPLGRDILSRILYGARLSLPVGVLAVALAVLIGLVVGSAAGFFGGAVDEVIMRLTDLMLAFPTIILAMVISAALGAGIKNALIAIMIAWWPGYARLVRGLVLSTREREFVVVARAIGASELRVLVRHVLPTIISPIVILATLDVGNAILTFASLSFLGLGATPDVAEWGAMISVGRTYFDQWWIGTFPGLAILSLVLAFNIVGDSLRDVLDPRYRKV